MRTHCNFPGRCARTMLVLLLAAFASYANCEQVFYVDGAAGVDAAGRGTLEAPFKTIGYAIDAVASTPATIEIAAGVYSPDTNGEAFPLELVSGLTLSGATTGETLITVRSGTSGLLSCTGSHAVTIRGCTFKLFNPDAWDLIEQPRAGAISLTNCRDVLVAQNRFVDSVVCWSSAGVSIINSDVQVFDNEFMNLKGTAGGAITARSSSLELVGNAFTDCLSGGLDSGGAVYLRQVSLVCTDNDFVRCRAQTGGAIRMFLGGSYLIEGCRFLECSARHGAAIDAYILSGDVTVLHCSFDGNTSYGMGGAIRSFQMSFVPQARLAVKGCRFTGNEAITGLGGAIFSLYGNLEIENCLFAQNQTDVGGAVYFLSDVSPTIDGCTFTSNSAADGVGAVEANCPAFDLRSCILWDNGEHIRGASAVYSCVQGGLAGVGNIADDPSFVSGPYGDYYLSHTQAGDAADSPCLGAGLQLAQTPFEAGTTRRDGVPDASCRDMGFHYPFYPETARVSLSAPEGRYFSGDTFELFASCVNPTQGALFDVYLGMIDPAGHLYCCGGSGWSSEIAPLISGIYLPYGFSISGYPLLSAALPSDAPPISLPGDYAFLAVLTPSGSFSFLHDPSAVSFNYVIK